MVCKVTLLDAHFPVGIVVHIVIVIPFQFDMVVFHIFYKVSLADVLLCPWLSPGEGEDAIFFCNVISQPSFESVSVADLLPNDVWRLRFQRILNVYFYATKLRKNSEIKNIFPKNFGGSEILCTFAPA